MRRLFAASGILVCVLIALGEPAWPATPYPGGEGARLAAVALHACVEFGPLLERIEDAKGASVSSVCGSGFAPWAYRGRTYGARTSLRPYVTDRADRSWAQTFVRLLMREADWDSTQRTRTSRKTCSETHRVPFYVVELHTRPNVYALLDFETRWAQVFEADRPLGAVRFADRAESLFVLVRSAMRSDSLTQTLSLPPARPQTDRSASVTFDSVFVEVLPVPMRRVPPAYPHGAREADVQGLIWIQAFVDVDGAVSDAFVIQRNVEWAGPPRGKHTSEPDERAGAELEEAALGAVWQWTFKPATTGGEPVAVWVVLPVKFTLQ